jgi:hypothetical protein
MAGWWVSGAQSSMSDRVKEAPLGPAKTTVNGGPVLGLTPTGRVLLRVVGYMGSGGTTSQGFGVCLPKLRP